MTKQVWPSLQPPPVAPPRKPRTVRKAFLRTVGVLLAIGLALVLLIVLFALAVHPGDSTVRTQPGTVQLSPKATAPVSTAPSTPPLSMNNVAVPFSWYSGTGTATVKSAEWSTLAMSTYGSAPKNGAFLTIDVVVTGVSGTVQANPYFWHVQDSLGHIYDWSWDSKEPALHLADLTPGEVSSGFVSFDVAQAPVTVTLTNGTATLARWAVAGA
jgi:hypothetical protein